MSNPSAQQPTMPRMHDERSHPTAWFLAVVTLGWPHPSFVFGRHVYVSRSESGQYRMLGQCGAVMVMGERVAVRHLRRCRDESGRLIRVRGQQHQEDRFNEGMAESRRQSAAA